SDGIFENYSYTAFGEELFSPPSSQNPWRFSSKRTDNDTGLVYYGRRYYTPKIGRFLTPDPLGLEAGPNLYAFVLNDPLTHFDLYGLLEDGWISRSMEKARDSVAAATHGTIDFAIRSVDWTGSAFNHLGSSLLELDASGREFSSSQWATSQEKHLNAINHGITGVMNTVGVNTSSGLYQRVRSGTTTAWEVTSCAVGAYGLAKGGFYGMRKTTQYSSARLGRRTASKINVLKTLETRMGQLTNNKIIHPTQSQNLTPVNFFKSKTYTECQELFNMKFGLPKPGAPGGMSFFNRRTGRTFHLHQQPGHWEGKPHIDIRRRGPYQERKYLLKDLES
ncbi:MAG: hypothetical protein JSS09_04015, partial [Verrucomicrobia bacterium]|nr:hypothetical protein [Verrucomicrobiota bacterium]